MKVGLKKVLFLISLISIFVYMLTFSAKASNFCMYEYWSNIVNKESKQYKFKEKVEDYTTEGIGFYKDRYVVCISKDYKYGIGDEIDITLQNGTVLNCVVGDLKNTNNAMLEFLVADDFTNDVFKQYLNWNSPIESISLVDNEKVYLPSEFCIDVDCILQNPELPTGCEIVSLAIVLNHLGFDVDKCYLADNYLPCGKIGNTDPNKAFIGSPYDKNSYGCYSNVIFESTCKFLKDNNADAYYTVEELKGCALDTTLVEKLYMYNEPIILWGSINMVDMKVNRHWTVDGNNIDWANPNHCLVLIGWDEENYIFADPLKGIVSYNKEQVIKQYNFNGKQAVFIRENGGFMSCPRNGEKCYEFMCGNSIEGICGGPDNLNTIMHKVLQENSIEINGSYMVHLDTCLKLIDKYIKN